MASVDITLLPWKRKSVIITCVCVYLQKEVPKLMRQGLDQLIEFDKKSKHNIRVYTYEDAVKRF